MLRILIFLAALTSGGTAAWLALAMPTSEMPMTTIVQAAPQALTQEVLVASTDLGQGQTLSEANVRWQPWPENSIHPGFITRSARPDAPETLNRAVVRSHFVSGEPIREDKLAPADSSFLSAMLPPGKRAVAVRISAENTAGGFVLPNDRVDLIHTVTKQAQTEGLAESVSRTILTNVRVLAIDQKADDANADAVVVGKTATLELDPLQAESVVAAEASGLLSMALRSTEDNDEAPTSIKQQASLDRDDNVVVGIMRSGKIDLFTVKVDHNTKPH